MMGVLAGIRVLDFGRYIAGPYCAALLAENLLWHLKDHLNERVLR